MRRHCRGVSHIIGQAVYVPVEPWLSGLPDRRLRIAEACDPGMRFRLLGPLEVRVGDDWKGIGAPKWRSVLAALLINAGQIVSAETLIDEVWGDDRPAKAVNLISIYVLRLRRLLGDADSSLLVTRAPGYQLRVAATDIDALRFEAMVRDGRRVFGSGDPQGAARQLTEALALWYGRPLADVRATPLVEAE